MKWGKCCLLSAPRQGQPDNSPALLVLGTSAIFKISPVGTMVIANDIPGTEVPGYFHGVPLGRENGVGGLDLHL